MPRTRRPSSSRFCAFGVGDTELRDLAFGSLGPIAVAFVADDAPPWEQVASLLEAIAFDRLRCLLADPSRCHTTAQLLGYTGRPELLLIRHGLLTERIEVPAPMTDVAILLSGCLATGP